MVNPAELLAGPHGWHAASMESARRAAMGVPMVGIEVRVVGYGETGVPSEWWVETHLDDGGPIDRFGPFASEAAADGVAAGFIKMVRTMPRSGAKMRR